MRKLVAGVLLGVGAAGLVLLLAALFPGALDTLELQLYDWRVRRTADPANASRDILLVEINDTSIRDLVTFFGRWPWPRVAHAHLLNYLSRGQPKVIAVDLLFTEADGTLGYNIAGDQITAQASDKALADAIGASGNVIALAETVYEGLKGGAAANKPSDWKSQPYRLGPAIEERRVIIPPLPAIADASMAIGHNFLAMDEDGPARRIVPFVRQRDRYMPSLGVAAALAAGGFKAEDVVLEGETIRIGDRKMPLVPVMVKDVEDASKTREQWTSLINYRAPVLDFTRGVKSYRSYEARHLLASEDQILSGQEPMVDPSEFKGKIVFVGLTTSGLIDRFQTPFGEGTMPGIQLHATVADSILSNRFIHPARSATRIWTTIGLALVVGLLAAFLPFVGATVGTLFAISGWTWYVLSAFRDGAWVNMTQPLLAAAVALFAGTAYQYFVEGRQKRIVKKLFGRYVSKDVYEQLVARPELAELGGARRDMSVLFSDIRGFTTVTEKGKPEELVAQLNEYFSSMVEVVFRHHGTVDKFVGDMVMALFGAPLDDVDHAEHAVRAAIEMVAELGALNRKWAAEGRAQLDIGIGVNSGEMIAGNIGSSSIMSYTVIGDNVNLGARLESLNKEYATRIIISDATRARLTNNYRSRPLGDVVVKGKTRPVAIFEIVVPSPLMETTQTSA